MMMLNDKATYVNQLLSGVYDYIKRMDPYAYKNPEIDATWIVVNKDDLTVKDAYYLSCCAGVVPTHYTDGTLISVVEYDTQYTVKYSPACSKMEVLRRFAEQHQDGDLALMNAITNYFLDNNNVYLYSYKKYGIIHYGVADNTKGSVYEGTIKQ